ncbi:Hypothetical predicted protein [Paramuricea clavata]|uniref:Uncharacterized protein n=1 Tax=Paramuricea clavata TaxID=317549 RepID=A0A6S7KEI1_PARCT|nr:Hypothetical predicted protein [Paramuricea clavata]
MAEDGEVSPALSLNVVDAVATVEDNELTPSPTGLKGKQRATKRRHSETSSSSKSSSSSSSSSSSDNSDSDKSASSKDGDYKRRKKRKSSPERKATPKTQATRRDTSPDPGSDVDVYVRFDTDNTTSEKLVLPKDMVKYLANKFTSYVPDKDIQETVLELVQTLCRIFNAFKPQRLMIILGKYLKLWANLTAKSRIIAL